MPLEDIQAAIVTRLTGNITRLPVSGGTPLPIYDSVPEGDKGWDFIEIASGRATQQDPFSGQWNVRMQLDVFSTYAGFLEVNSEVTQIVAALGTPLAIANKWSDVQAGGVPIEVETTKLIFEEGGPIVRRASFLQSWMVSDDTF